MKQLVASFIFCGICVFASDNNHDAISGLHGQIGNLNVKVLQIRKNMATLELNLLQRVNLSFVTFKADLRQSLLADLGIMATNHPENNVMSMLARLGRMNQQLKTQQQQLSREIEHLKELKQKKEEKCQSICRDQVTDREDLRAQLDDLRENLEKLSRKVAISEGCKPKPLVNPSFETEGGWTAFGHSSQVESVEAQDGNRFAQVTSGGTFKLINFATPIRKLIVSGWSKNMGSPASINPPSDYSLYCDLKTPSGDNLWAYNTPFTLRSSGWHKATVKIDLPPSKAISEARCYFLYRNINQGVAYFDNMSAYVVSDDVTDLSICSQG